MQPIGIDFFASLQYPHSLRVGPGGALAFATKQANIEKNRYDTALWVYTGGKPRRIRGGGTAQAHWWWDENTLLVMTCGGARHRRLAEKGLPTAAFKLVPVGGGASQPLLCLHMAVENAWPLPGGRLLVLAQRDPAVEAALQAADGDLDVAAETLQAEAACTVWEELPFWENGGGSVSGKRRQLVLWDGESIIPLTPETMEVEEVALDAAGKTACLIAKDYTDVAPVQNRLYTLHLPTGALREKTAKPMRHDAFLPLPGGGYFVAGSDMAAHGLNQNPAFYRLGEDGTLTALYTGGAYGLYCSVNTDVNIAGSGQVHISEDGTWAAFLTTRDGDGHLMRLDLQTGHIAPITRQPGAVFEASPAPGGGFYAVAMRGSRPPEVVRIAENGGEAPVTRFSSGQAWETAPMRPLSIPLENGAAAGWVLLPKGAETAKKQTLPGILYIHGGPKTAYGTVLFHEMQYWAAQGYAVLLCNPPGSDGRGDGYADIRGGYGAADCDALLRFADEALKANPCIDPHRLGVAGGSYGGFMVNWLVGHTGRFRAAVSQRGIANWGTMALLSDIGYTFVPDQTGLLPQDGAGLLAASPLSCAQQATTPTLFLHSDEDLRCPLAEGMQMYSALRLNNVPSRMVVFHGENHHLSRAGLPQNRLRRLREMKSWFDQYLKD